MSKLRRFTAYRFPNGYQAQATNMWEWLRRNGLTPSWGKTRRGGGDIIMLPVRERASLRSLKAHHPARFGSNPGGRKYLGMTGSKKPTFSIGSARGSGRRTESYLSVPEQHRLKIAYQTLRYSDAGARIMGGMTKAEARDVIKRLTGRTVKENPRRRKSKRAISRKSTRGKRKSARNGRAIDPIVRQIVDRCHIHDRLSDVLRYTLTRMKDKGKKYKGLPRKKRRQLMKMIQQVQKHNQKIYRYAMTGR